MINPFFITNFNRSHNELQEFLLFAILVAGKRADYTAKKLQLILERLIADETNFIFDVKLHSPFDLFQNLSYEDIQEVLKDAGIGCYKLKSQAIKIITSININLYKCDIDDLETIKGIGKKTSRYFILHSRKDAKCIPLDTHALKFLRDNNIKAPKNTPQNHKQYKNLEEEYINLCPINKTLAEFDLFNWTNYAKK